MSISQIMYGKRILQYYYVYRDAFSHKGADFVKKI
jgi:hypothetical protein